MKKIIFIICIIITQKTFSQTDCTSLENFKSFHGISFGKEFPDSLSKPLPFLKDTIPGEKYIRYSLPFLATNFGKYSNFKKWFMINVQFDHLLFYCSMKNKVIGCLLYTDSGAIKSTSKEKVYPDFCKKAIAELNTLFGVSSYDINNNDILSTYWTCGKMEVSITYVFKTKDCNIEFVDKELDKENTIDWYK